MVPVKQVNLIDPDLIAPWHVFGPDLVCRIGPSGELYPVPISDLRTPGGPAYWLRHLTVSGKRWATPPVLRGLRRAARAFGGLA